ncbi:hypothetical protein M9458_012275, partial [Cirrhinus mrigala]
QSVTGVDSADDANSYWRIRGKPDKICQRGEPIQCGQAIRITHMKTGRNLHSHHFSSPLSNHQVDPHNTLLYQPTCSGACNWLDLNYIIMLICFTFAGKGDDLDVWTVQCSDTYWERDEAVRFKHVATEVFLSVTGEQYGQPIRGQREVHGMPSPNQHNYWKVMEGVFIQPSSEPARHDEL